MPSRARVPGTGWVAIALLAGTIAWPVAASAASRCFGEPATIVGTNGDDRITGTNGPDVIVSRAGADNVRGRGGFDLICAGPGHDRLFGGPGGEFIFGGEGNDELDGGRGPFSDFAPGPGDDLVVGSTFSDAVHFPSAERAITASLVTGTASGEGSDALEQIDALLGGPFDDTLIGNADDNGLIGRAGDDTLRGW